MKSGHGVLQTVEKRPGGRPCVAETNGDPSPPVIEMPLMFVTVTGIATSNDAPMPGRPAGKHAPWKPPTVN